MTLQDIDEFSTFWAFEFFLGMLSGQKIFRHSEWFEGLKLKKTQAPYAVVPGTGIKKQDGVVGV